MSKSTFKGSLLATTVIAGMAFAQPAFAQDQTTPETAPPAPVTPTNTQGDAPPAAPSDQTPAAGVQSSESAAPAEPASAQEIVITGTLIRNPNLVASAPVTVVGQEEVRLRQTNTAEEVLRTIPGAAPGAGAQVNNGSVGASFVNLRSLGTNRNVVLLDGVRIVPFDQNLRVDLNNIPLALIDRVDVLTGGASSTYGADAVAGVINFITRSDFSGMELSVSDGITQKGDGNYLRGDLTLGANFDDGRGNAVISIGYQESDPVYQGGERGASTLAIDSRDPTNLALAGSSTAVPSAFDIPGLSRRQVSADGQSIVPFYSAFNFNPYNIFQTPFKRYNLFSSGHYDISDDLTVYGRGLFSDNSVKTIQAPSGVFASSVTVPVSNPFLTAAQRSFFCANADFNPTVAGVQTLTAAQCAAAATATSTSDPNYRQFTMGLRRRTTEIGGRVSDYHTRTFDFRVGVRGDITDKIGFDVFGSRGSTNSVQNISGYALLSRVREALLSTNPNTCLSGNPDCVPLNIFGVEGTITPEQGTFINGRSTVTTNVTLSQARGTINGDTPLQLWAKNPVSFALGTEYRKYKSDILPDALAQSGDLGGFGTAPPPVNGGLDVYEGFAEVIAPLVSDRPFFQELQVEAGIRRSHYTIASPSNPKFNTTTWKIAGSWAPVRDFKVRGNYQHAVRAPNISELFTPLTTILTNLGVDPCAGAAPLQNANLRAVCLAQGAPAGTIGSIQNPTSNQANITTGGNLNLKPEIAKTWTVGAVLRPSFIPGLSATVDYYNIKVRKAITVPTSADLISACFDNLTAASATNPACTVIRRDQQSGGLDGDTTEVPGLFGILTNAGRIATDGIDVTLDYRRKLGDMFGSPAKLALAFGGNWTHSQKFQATPSSVNRQCVGYYSANCGYPNGQIQPKISWNQRSTLSLGRLDLSMLWHHLGKSKYEPRTQADEEATADASNRDASGNLLPVNLDRIGDAGFQACPDYAGADPGGCIVDPAFRKIKAKNYFDFTTRFNVNEHFDLTFTVANLFDTKPPFVGNTVGTSGANSGNTYPSTYDPLGRRFTAGARIKF